MITEEEIKIKKELDRYEKVRAPNNIYDNGYTNGLKFALSCFKKVKKKNKSQTKFGAEALLDGTSPVVTHNRTFGYKKKAK